MLYKPSIILYSGNIYSFKYLILMYLVIFVTIMKYLWQATLVKNIWEASWFQKCKAKSLNTWMAFMLAES